MPRHRETTAETQGPRLGKSQIVALVESMPAMMANAGPGGCLRQPDRHASIDSLLVSLNMLRLKTGRSSVMRPNRNAPGQKKTAMRMKMLRYYSYENGGGGSAANRELGRAAIASRVRRQRAFRIDWSRSLVCRPDAPPPRKLAELQLDAFPRFRKTVRHA